jgi:phage terminase large subunit-like protein
VAKRKKATPSPPTENERRDFVAIAIDYANQAVADRKGKKFGKWVRLAARRFLADLKRAKQRKCTFTFDPWHACDPCDFLEKLPHVEGKWNRATIVLEPFQVFLTVQLFGFRHRQDGTRRFTTALFAVARKNAKALAIDTPVPTPSGWSTMGDLAPGDVVFGADGQPCTVTAVSPVHVDHECYRLDFSNGEQVTADAGHRWLTTAHVDSANGHRVGNGKTRTRVRTTEEIATTLRFGARRDVNHSLRMPEPLECEPALLPVAPYTLGAWLGDGHSASARITFAREDTDILDRITADGWPVREKYQRSGKASTFAISDGDHSQAARDKSLATLLRRMGVLNNKHIPSDYLRASKMQRLALLQGLMDTDGTVSKNGRVISYTSISEKLTEGVSELLGSFGIKYSWRRNSMRCNRRPVPGIAHTLQFMAFRDEIEVFGLRRKLDRMRVRLDCDISPRSQTVQIVEAERVASVPVRCITVDSPDSLFLFGRTMLPTHNSTWGSGILLYCLCCEDEVGPQVISAATTGSQARIVFNVAKKMVERLPALQEAFLVQPFANAIANYQNGGSFKPINAKASTQDGLNPSATCLDEVHAHKTSELLDVLQSAAGARGNPLWLYTTTEGYETPGPWPELRQFAKQVLEGVVEADHFLAVYYALDDDDDDFDESKYVKANPLLDASPVLARELKKAATEAKAMPGRLAEFRIKRLNRQSSSANGWIDLQKWKKCAGTVDLDALEGARCFAALDLASTTDMAAWRLIWLVDDLIYTWGRRWVPEEAVKRRELRGMVPYEAWRGAGLIEATPGDVIDYAVIERAIREDVARFNPELIAYDRWNATDLVNRLAEDQMPLIEFVQGPKSFHPAMQMLERAYLSKKLVHDGDPVLQWCASNLIPRYDANMNTAPDKKRSPEKIDDMVALIMAVGVSQSDELPSVIGAGYELMTV